METKIKTIVADGHQIYREGLKMALSKLSRVEIVGEAANGNELMEILLHTNADLILLDTEMPGTDGINLCKTITSNFSCTKVIAITIFNDLNYLASIINSGVNCFLQKNTSRKELERAINVVIDGQILFPIHVNQYKNHLKFTIMKTTKILLVDDDIDVITVLQTILSKNGYNVVTASNKVEGMRKLREEKPDLAILDVMMSTHYEGFEMAKEINDDATLRNIPVLMQTSIEILVTTNPSVQDMAREFRKNPGFKELYVLLVKDIVSDNAGIDYLSENGKSIWFPVDGFLSKPIDVNKLIPEINRIMNKRTKEASKQ